MADPYLNKGELRFLDFIIAKAEERGVSSSGIIHDFFSAAEDAADIMRGVPMLLGPEASGDTIAAKVHATLLEALKTPGLTLEQLKRIRTIIRTF